ncbi:hypothetical protein Syun_031677 [Stephania yunnanensis]|uniref:FAD-binding PCMH-type domain-containing protein n=1 Tax=Stephania yunnanensis TaxID=152371 RepID=A0AAP0DYI8_9MAGN
MGACVSGGGAKSSVGEQRWQRWAVWLCSGGSGETGVRQRWSLAVMAQGWRTTRLEGGDSDSWLLGRTTPPRCRSEVEEDRPATPAEFITGTTCLSSTHTSAITQFLPHFCMFVLFMMKLMSIHKITITLFICVIMMITLLPPTTASHHNNIEALYSCLSSNGVHNFTTTPNDHHRLFNLVIQNPIFTRPIFNKPTTIVLPQSKEQLATTISCCTHGSWTIRLRSGGHSYEGLSQTAQTHFVIIDLMNLNRVEIDLKSETAWVESGATLGEIYYAISQASDELGFSAILAYW